MMQMMEPRAIPSVENANEILESAGAAEPHLNVEKLDTTIVGMFYTATRGLDPPQLRRYVIQQGVAAKVSVSSHHSFM